MTKAEIVYYVISLAILLLIVGAIFLAGLKCAKAAERRKRYREEHPRYMHSGGQHEPN